MFTDKSHPIDLAPKVQINYSSTVSVIKRDTLKHPLEDDKRRTRLSDMIKV